MLKNLFKKKRKEKEFDFVESLVCESLCSGIKVERVAFRPFYDTEWKVTTPHFSTIITRYETEEANSLLKAIESLPVYTEEEIKKLDKKSKIWYD